VAFCDDGMQIPFTTGGDLWVMDTVLREPKRVHGATRTHERDCVFTPDGGGALLSVRPRRRRRAVARGTRGRFRLLWGRIRPSARPC
jgi:hypothetical protein